MYRNYVRSLSLILLSEGYWQKGSYYYFLKDHLGSNRVVLQNDGYIAETSNYYPSGMRFGESVASGGNVQPYRHIGKEMQSMHGLNWYDNGARMRQVDIPVWTTLDPLAEKYYSISPYAYALNNPVRLIDPNGEDVYLFYWVKSDDQKQNAMFSEAALTRALDALKNMKEGDIYKISAIEDLGTLGSKVESDVKELSPKYGDTREFGLWSHSGKLDGPRGSVTSSGPDGKGTQLSLEGWGGINFNWAKDGNTKAGFYGCNTGRDPDGDGPKASFTTNLSALSNFHNVSVWGQTSSAYPSKYTNVRDNDENMIDGKYGYPTYMVSAGSLNVIGRFLPTWTPANPMRVSVNGKGITVNAFGKLIYQPGKMQ